MNASMQVPESKKLERGVVLLRYQSADKGKKNMETFTQTIEGWHDFYLMIGAAAATLVGLLFVSLSLNVDMITREENAMLRQLATETFAIFISVLLFAVLFLIPGQSPRGLGLPLLGIGMLGAARTVVRLLETRRMRRRALSRGTVAARFVLPTLCFVILLIIAASVLLGQTDGLYWLVPVMILLIVSASQNAWDLLLGLHKAPTES